MQREEWLVDRTKGIGASESPAILGADPYKDALDIYVKKIFPEEPAANSPKLNEAATWGLILEPSIVQEYSKRSGNVVQHNNNYDVVWVSDKPWIRCTRDALVFDKNRGCWGILQIKTTAAHKEENWRFGPPTYVWIQVQHEMYVCNLSYAIVACLFGGQLLKHYIVEYDKEFIENKLVPTLDNFWNNHICKQIPPEPGAQSRPSLKKIYPQDDGSVIRFDLTWTPRFERLAELKGLLKQLETEKDQIQNDIVFKMGTASYAIGENEIFFSLKTVEQKGYTKEVAPSTIRALRSIKHLPKELLLCTKANV
jgi:putative phage-type endonuclease